MRDPGGNESADRYLPVSQPPGQRTERREPDALVRTQRKHLPLGLTIQEAVRVLHQSKRASPRLSLIHNPRASRHASTLLAPIVEHLAARTTAVERRERFFERVSGSGSWIRYIRGDRSAAV